MAWPSSRLQDFLSGTPPFIEALTLNSIQDTIIAIVSGTVTVNTLYADGTGGGALSQLPGLVVASGLVTHTFLPGPNTYAAGTLAQGTVPRAWAVVNADGSFGRGYKVYSTGRTMGVPVGEYTVVFSTLPADPVNVCPWLTILDATPALISALPAVVGGRQALAIRVVDTAGTPVDKKVACGLLGE